MNETCGYCVRSKPATDTEGGVMCGSGKFFISFALYILLIICVFLQIVHYLCELKAHWTRFTFRIKLRNRMPSLLNKNDRQLVNFIAQRFALLVRSALNVTKVSIESSSNVRI